VNPWVGYGLGLEWMQTSREDFLADLVEDTTSFGVTYAQLSAGVDWRRRDVGFGPLVELAVGEFFRTTTELGPNGGSDDEVRSSVYRIRDRALHAWLMLGLRLVINP
jgi:hypothetical protein